MALTINKNKRFVFVGGKITESGRFHDVEELGLGYVRLIRDLLRARHPATAPVVLNRGMGATDIREVASRWQKDVLDELPDVVSLLIDAPDPDRRLPNEIHTPLDGICEGYRELFAQTARYLPRCEFVLCEPAALWSPRSIEHDEELRRYRNTLLDISRGLDGHPLVPVHSGFIFAARERPDIRWIADDGQPSSAGHMLIANSWLEENGLAPRARG